MKVRHIVETEVQELVFCGVCNIWAPQDKHICPQKQLPEQVEQ